MITIRIASIADAELIAEMSRATFYDSFAAQNTKENMDKFLGEQFTRETLMKEVGGPDNIFLLAYHHDKPAGYVRIRENNNPPSLGTNSAIEIARIYAVAWAIGLGIGSALMKECIQIGKEKGVECLWLGVWEHNQRAINFYKKWEFEKFDEHDFILGDDVQTDWLMRKNLYS